MNYIQYYTRINSLFVCSINVRRVIFNFLLNILSWYKFVHCESHMYHSKIGYLNVVEFPINFNNLTSISVIHSLSIDTHVHATSSLRVIDNK